MTRLDVKPSRLLSPSFQIWGKSPFPVEATMSDCRRQWNREDELPVYLAGPITTGPNQRKSFGMFSSVEGAFESKTIDFDNYAVGRKGSRTPRSGSRERLLDTGDSISKTPSEAREGSLTNSPAETDDGRPDVEVRYSSGKESPDGEVGLTITRWTFFLSVWLFYVSTGLPIM